MSSQRAGHPPAASAAAITAPSPAQIASLRARYGDLAPPTCMERLLQCLAPTPKPARAAPPLLMSVSSQTLLSNGVPAEHAPQLARAAPTPAAPTPTPAAPTPAAQTAAPAAAPAAAEQEPEADREEREKAVRFMQKCYRGRLGRSLCDARAIEVQMTSKLDIGIDDDDCVTHVNEYEMGRILGQGAYGIVYMARAASGPSAEHGDVAVKVLNRSVLGRKKVGAGTALDLVLKEIGVMKNLKHPNCVQLFEVIDDPAHDHMYLVMEFVAGGDLAAPIARKEVVPEARLRTWMRDAVVGLEYLHSYNILHRDIKPENILWDEAHQLAKIADFGVSDLQECHQRGDRFNFARDYVKATAGTPAFYAPEMCGDDKTGSKVYSGRAADLWALGVCLYMWMFHRLPFEAPTVYLLMSEIRDHTLEVPATYAASAELLAVLRGLLAKKPRHRLRMRDLRRDAWMTEGLTWPLPPLQGEGTGRHATVSKGELGEILREAVVQLRATHALSHAAARGKEGKRFLDENKPVATAPPPKPPPRRGPGMLKRAA